jgi:hypothetical protein
MTHAPAEAVKSINIAMASKMENGDTSGTMKVKADEKN